MPVSVKVGVVCEMHRACTAVVLPGASGTDNATTMHLRDISEGGCIVSAGIRPPHCTLISRISYQLDGFGVQDTVNSQTFLQLSTRFVAEAVDRLLQSFVQIVTIVPANRTDYSVQ